MRWKGQGSLRSTGTPETPGRIHCVDKQCSQQGQTLGPSFLCWTFPCPDTQTIPLCRTQTRAGHKEQIQRRDQLSCAHDAACLPPAPGPRRPPLQPRAWPTCVFPKRKPGVGDGPGANTPAMAPWVLCQHLSAHPGTADGITSPLLWPPGPRVWHSAGTHCVLLRAPTAQGMPGPWHGECGALGRGMCHPTSPAAAAPLGVVPVPWARNRQLSPVGKAIPSGNQAQGSGC